MKDSRDVVRESFNAGYEKVKYGEIKSELTAFEIAARYPQFLSDPFTQGMLDALRNDDFRYLRTKTQDA